MGAGQRDDHQRRQPARHRLGNAQDVVPTRARIAGRAPCVGSAVAAEVELGEFAAIHIPLKDDRLCPVVPDGRRKNHVRVDRQIAMAGFVSIMLVAIIVAVDSRQAVAGAAVDRLVLTCQVHVRQVVVRLVHRQAARVRVMPAKRTPRC